MTGFGRGVATVGPVQATVDLRTVNHRFLDLKLRTALAPALEEQLTAKIRAGIERGSVVVGIHVARPTAAAGGLRIDEAAAQQAFTALHKLATTLGLAPPDLALVLAQPGVVQTGSDEASEPGDAAILAALDQALTQLAEMRAVEGAALLRELLLRLDELAALRDAIASHASTITEHLHKKLLERLTKLLGDSSLDEARGSGGIDPARLAQEVALLAERADITEELVRLASHFDQARAVANAPAASGRKLDFLVQEIGRELNTIGSKSQRTEISGAVVEAKSVLEKLREQVQNVE